jgi:hypothetical protein
MADNCKLVCNYRAKKGADGTVIKKGNGVQATDLSTRIVHVEQVKTREPVMLCQSHYGLIVTLNTGIQLIVHKVHDRKQDAFATAVSLVEPGDYHKKKYEVFASSPVRDDVTVNTLIDAADQKKAGYAFHFVLNNCKDAMMRMYEAAVGSDGNCRRSEKYRHDDGNRRRGQESRYEPPPPYSPSGGVPPNHYDSPRRGRGPYDGMFGDDSRLTCNLNYSYNIFGPGGFGYK